MTVVPANQFLAWKSFIFHISHRAHWPHIKLNLVTESGPDHSLRFIFCNNDGLDCLLYVCYECYSLHHLHIPHAKLFMNQLVGTAVWPVGLMICFLISFCFKKWNVKKKSLTRCFKSSVTDIYCKNFHMPTGMSWMQSGEVCVSYYEGVSRGCLKAGLQMLLFCQPFTAKPWLIYLLHGWWTLGRFD